MRAPVDAELVVLGTIEDMGETTLSQIVTRLCNVGDPMRPTTVFDAVEALAAAGRVELRRGTYLITAEGRALLAAGRR